MTDLEEAKARKAFQEAVARYHHGGLQPGAVFADFWMAASQASEEAGKLSDHWREQRDLWFDKANEAVPDAGE